MALETDYTKHDPPIPLPVGTLVKNLYEGRDRKQHVRVGQIVDNTKRWYEGAQTGALVYELEYVWPERIATFVIAASMVPSENNIVLFTPDPSMETV